MQDKKSAIIGFKYVVPALIVACPLWLGRLGQAEPAGTQKVGRLQVVSSIEGEPLPVAIPVMPGAKFTHGYVADSPEGRSYLVYVGASDFEGAVRFYDGVFWQVGCIVRGPIGSLRAGYEGAPTPKEALAAGKWFHVRYGPDGDGQEVWLTIRKADARARREGYEYTVVFSIGQSRGPQAHHYADCEACCAQIWGSNRKAFAACLAAFCASPRKGWTPCRCAPRPAPVL